MPNSNMGDIQVDTQPITVLGKPQYKQKTAEKLHIHVNNIGNLQCGQNNTLLFITSSDTEKKNIDDDRQHGGDAEVAIVNENNVQLKKYNISGRTILSIGDNCRLAEIKLNEDIQRKLDEKGEFKVTRGDKLVSVIWKNYDTMDNDSPTITELKINFLKDGKTCDTKELERDIFDMIRKDNNVRLRKLIIEFLSTFKAILEHIEMGCIQLVVSSKTKDHAHLLETRQEELKDLLRRTIIPESVNMDIVFRTKGEDELKPVLESQSTQEPSLKDPQETKTQKTHDVYAKQEPQLEALTNPSPETKVETGRMHLKDSMIEEKIHPSKMKGISSEPNMFDMTSDIKSPLESLRFQHGQELPLLCQTCLGNNPNLRMIKEKHEKECETCNRPFPVFRWCPGARMRFKKTKVCQTCSQEKNSCQSCLVDLEYDPNARFQDSLSKSDDRLPRQYHDTPKLEPPEDKTNTTLYVGGLGEKVHSDDLMNCFHQFGEIRSINMMHKQQCAFVQFTNRSSAEFAAENSSNRLIIKGQRLSIQWSRPPGQQQSTKKGENEEEEMVQSTRDMKIQVPLPPPRSYQPWNPSRGSSSRPRESGGVVKPFGGGLKYPSQDPNREGVVKPFSGGLKFPSQNPNRAGVVKPSGVGSSQNPNSGGVVKPFGSGLKFPSQDPISGGVGKAVKTTEKNVTYETNVDSLQCDQNDT